MTFQALKPIDWLKVEAANAFGANLDKQNWDHRIDWFDDHLITAKGIDPIQNLYSLTERAEEPALFYSAVSAYERASKGLTVHSGVSLDACSSGLQILSVLVSCPHSAKLCGVIDIGTRADAYTLIYEEMRNRVDESADIKRADLKQAIMTSLYSSKAVPRQVFGRGEMLKTFYQVMTDMAPGAWELNESLQGLWQPYELSHDWVLPDNYHVHVKVKDQEIHRVNFMGKPYEIAVNVNKGTKNGLSISPNIIHSIDGMIVREITRRCQYNEKNIKAIRQIILSGIAGKEVETDDDKMVRRLWNQYKISGFLSARILDHITMRNFGLIDDPKRIAILIQTMPKQSFPVIPVHDCFRVHPNYANDLRVQYNQILSEIAGSDLLAFIASQIMGRIVPAKKLGNIASQIIGANYSLS